MQDVGASLRFKRPRSVARLRLLIIVLGVSNVIAYTQSVVSAPRAEKLEAGDLIWPKKPGTVVPYNSRPGAADEGEAEQWTRERDAYLEELLAKAERTKEEKQRYAALHGMTYREFRAQYFSDSTSGDAVGLGSVGLGVGVGHVGIIEVADGKRNVVEAMVRPGVRRISYEEWLGERVGEQIWVGRLKGVSPEKRAAVAKIAAGYIGRPYKFWNFNLEDTSGFYCSKLAWFAIRQGAEFSVDDRSSHRLFWFSPKQLMNSEHIQLIINPGSYGRSD